MRADSISDPKMHMHRFIYHCRRMREIVFSSIDKKTCIQANAMKAGTSSKINQLDIWTWGTTKCSVRHDYHGKPALAGRVERGTQVAAVRPRHSLPTASCTVSAHVEALRLHVCQHVCAQDWPSILLIPWVKLVIWTLFGKKTKNDRAFHFFWKSHKAQCDNKWCGEYCMIYLFKVNTKIYICPFSLPR